MASTAEESPGYCDVCYLASNNDKYFSSFKRDISYQAILEHVNRSQGELYYSNITSKHIKSNIDLAKINDKLGNPVVYDYHFGQWSPTTLRYLKVLSDLSIYDLNNFSIAEIGAGYGGQYTVLRQFYSPKSYDFFDLEKVLPLIKKYVSNLNLEDIDISYENQFNRKKFRNEYDLLLSNYAISECDIDTQNYYFENVIRLSKRGYITFNHLRGYHIDDFLKILSSMKKDYKLVEEKPQTANNNIIIVW